MGGPGILHDIIESGDSCELSQIGEMGTKNQ